MSNGRKTANATASGECFCNTVTGSIAVENPKVISVEWVDKNGDKAIMAKYGAQIALRVKTEDAGRCSLLISVHCDDWTQDYLVEEPVAAKGVPYTPETTEETTITFTPDTKWLSSQNVATSEMTATVYLVLHKFAFEHGHAVLQQIARVFANDSARYNYSSPLDGNHVCFSKKEREEIPISPIVIVIDPGHGVKGVRKGVNMRYFDHGAIKLKDPAGLEYGTNVEYMESDIALDISEKLKVSLLRVRPQSNVYLTRTGELDLLNQTELDKNPLSFRWKYANSKNADIFISIHCNSGLSSASGFEICYHTASPNNISLSESICNTQKVIALRNPSHYKYKPGLGALSGFSGDVAILIEVGFIKNDEDVRLMTNNATEIANQIADGMKKWADNYYS